MSIKSGKFLQAVAALAVCAGTASAGEDIDQSEVFDVPFPTGRFAIYENGLFANYKTFSCASNGATYCQHLNYDKLTKEEQTMADGTEIKGDLLIDYDAELASYTLAGNIYVNRTCYVSTAKKGDDYGEYIPSKCDYNESAGILKCPVADPYSYEEQGASANVMLHIAADGSGISIDNIDLMQKSEDQMWGHCASALSSAKFMKETDSQFIHNQYLSYKLEFMRRDGELNAVWKRFPADVKKRIKKDQLAWIKEKDRVCSPVTIKAPEAELSPMYVCQTEFTNERIKVLEQSR